MKKSVKEPGGEIKLIKYRILTITYLTAFFFLIISSIKTEKEILFISSSIAIGILVLLNLRHVIINKRQFNSIKMNEKDVSETELHPLELYVFDRIWYHKKNRFTKKQIYAAILYEIECGNLEKIDSGVRISPTVNLSEIPLYSLVTLEMALLERIDCKKIKRLKTLKLKSLQAEQTTIFWDEINSNIKDNCLDKEIFYKLANDMKSKYFEEIEPKTTVYLTISSWICTILSLTFVFAFYNKATILNFYLPIILSVLLVATLTSNYRERVTFKERKKNFIFDVLNYINYLNKQEKNKINDIYAYCLDKTNDQSIISVLKK